MLNSIKKINKKLLTILCISFLSSFLFLALFFSETKNNPKEIIDHRSSIINSSPSVSPSPTPPPIPNSKILSNNGYHVFQSFNNCGPAALSMTLRFYGIEASQEVLGQALRPYQIPGGDNDDKSVTLEEVAEKSKEFGFIPYLRPMGDSDVLKKFIANDIPIIARTWTKPNEDIGHFRIIKGYDDSRGIFIQDDSLQGKNLEYTYSDFNEIWKKFNYEYLVLVPKEKQKLAEQIIGSDVNAEIAWQKAVENSKKQLSQNPNDTDARFNLSVAYYKLGNYEKSVKEFEKVENKISFRTLWYQIEPIQAYFELKNYDKVIEITDRVLNNQNRAFSELYILRGKIYQERNEANLAQEEFRKALLYNTSLKEAQELTN